MAFELLIIAVAVVIMAIINVPILNSINETNDLRQLPFLILTNMNIMNFILEMIAPGNHWTVYVVTVLLAFCLSIIIMVVGLFFFIHRLGYNAWKL